MDLEHTLSLGFTDERLPPSCHVCLLFEEEEQRRSIVSGYLAAGLRRREVVRYFADATPPEHVRAWLGDLGIDALAEEAKGSLTIASAESAYLAGGSFEPEGMIARMAGRYEVAARAGFTGARTTGEMSWVLKGARGADRFLEYEAMLNGVQSSFPHTGMCQYDARLFDGATLFRLVQVHPYLVIGGQIVRNPSFLRAEELPAGAPSHQ